MGLFRLVLLVLLVLVLLRLVRFVFAPPPASRAGRRSSPPPPPGTGPAPERLVQDPVCGIRIPESRAVRRGDVYFCSEECSSRYRPS
jgi:hypothetical protein